MSFWIACSTALPEHGERILVIYKKCILIAEYIGKENAEPLHYESDPWEGCTTNEDGEIFCPKGFYESPSWFDDEAVKYFLEGILHWAPLPSKPEEYRRS